MRLSTAISAATAAAVTLAIAAPGAGAMVNSGGGTPYSTTRTTHSDGLVSGAAVRPNPDHQAPRTGDLGEAPRGHTVGFRGCPRVGRCSSPYRVVTTERVARRRTRRRPPRTRRFSGVTPGSAQAQSCSCSPLAGRQPSRPAANVTASQLADSNHPKPSLARAPRVDPRSFFWRATTRSPGQRLTTPDQNSDTMALV